MLFAKPKLAHLTHLNTPRMFHTHACTQIEARERGRAGGFLNERDGKDLCVGTHWDDAAMVLRGVLLGTDTKVFSLKPIFLHPFIPTLSLAYFVCVMSVSRVLFKLCFRALRAYPSKSLEFPDHTLHCVGLSLHP